MRKREKKMNCEIEKEEKENDLIVKIKKITNGLYYSSETDEKILPFQGKRTEAVTAQEIINQTKSAESTPVEERDFNDFFAPLTEMQDWFGDEEKATAEKFAELKNLLEQNLQNLKVFKLGKIQLDIYVVGLDAQSNLTGIKTKAVET